MPLFEKTTNDDGTEIYVEVTDDALAETVKAHPLHQNVLKESIGRRKEISELRTRLDSLTAKDAVQEVKPAQETQAPAAVPAFDENAFMEKIFNALTQRDQAKTEREAKLNELIATNKLDPAVRPLLETSADPAKTADQLARLGSRFQAPATQANPDQTDDLVSSVMARVNDRLFANKPNIVSDGGTK